MGRAWLRDGLVDVSVDVEHVPGERGRPAPFMIFHAMEKLDVQSVQEAIKIGNTPADMLEGTNAGCRVIIHNGVGVTVTLQTAFFLGTTNWLCWLNLNSPELL